MSTLSFVNAQNAAGTKSLWDELMEILAQDIKSGDTFRYVWDWDILGNPIMSHPLSASDDAILVGARVMIPFGGEEGRTYMCTFGSKVEKISGTD